LTQLSALQRLDLQSCGLREVSALAELHQLTRLDLRNNYIANIVELLKVPHAVGNAILASGIFDNDVWMGLRLQASRITDDAGALPPYLGVMPPL